MVGRSPARRPRSRTLPMSSKAIRSPSRRSSASPKRRAARWWIDAGGWYPPKGMRRGSTGRGLLAAEGLQHEPVVVDALGLHLHAGGHRVEGPHRLDDPGDTLAGDQGVRGKGLAGVL